MKKICSFLCLSLFASLIHAAVMPMNLKNNTHLYDEQAMHSMHADTQINHDQANNHQANNHQACEEIPQQSSDPEAKEVCLGDGHPCCLGMILSPTFNLDLTASFGLSMVPKSSSLPLQTYLNFIFKPPKA